MAKKILLGLALLSMSALPAETALGATITLNPTCSFAKAVTWINTGTAQSGCTKSGTIGINDTIIVGLNNQEFTIANTVEIKKSVIIQSWQFYGALKTTSTSTPIAVKIAAKDIVVQFNSIILQGVANNTTTGIYVDGTNDTVNPYDIFAPKVLINSSLISGFRRSGLYIYQGNVDMYNTDLIDNSNMSSFTMGGGRGGAVRIESQTKIGRLNADSCRFDGNTAKRGGAIYNHGNLNMQSGLFFDNVATYPGSVGTGAAVFSEYFAEHYYTAFSTGGYFENNQADAGGYSIVAGAIAEFQGSTPYEAVGNSLPLCENFNGQQDCPTQ